MLEVESHYENLKIACDAPNEVIYAAYKALMQMYHPENHRGREEAALAIVQSIRESYEVLIDPMQRSAYDLWLKGQEANRANVQKEQAFIQKVAVSDREKTQGWIDRFIPTFDLTLIGVVLVVIGMSVLNNQESLPGEMAAHELSFFSGVKHYYQAATEMIGKTFPFRAN